MCKYHICLTRGKASDHSHAKSRYKAQHMSLFSLWELLALVSLRLVKVIYISLSPLYCTWSLSDCWGTCLRTPNTPPPLTSRRSVEGPVPPGYYISQSIFFTQSISDSRGMSLKWHQKEAASLQLQNKGVLPPWLSTAVQTVGRSSSFYLFKTNCLHMFRLPLPFELRNLTLRAFPEVGKERGQLSGWHITIQRTRTQRWLSFHIDTSWQWVRHRLDWFQRLWCFVSSCDFWPVCHHTFKA